ncbi:MAG: hypothetical protein IT353_09285 [Gemmatimonadaceae bacterium]|nr:hypothetical protein [Gemmatimonadaceae bacterium]
MPSNASLPRGQSRTDQRRRELREELWPGAEKTVWTRQSGEKGFTTVPRTISLICGLIKDLAAKGDPGRTYLDLWARTRDDGFVEVFDEQEFAHSAGYAENTRNVRTWRGHMATLEALGFIRVKPKLTRKYGYVLLVHPHDVVATLRERGNVRDDWWELFTNRLRDMGAKLRKRSAGDDA